MYAELIDKLKAATGPDRELDAMIAVSLQVMPNNAFAPCASPDPGTFGTGAYSFWRAPDYTGSIDAALALVEKMFDPEPSANHPIEMTLTSTGYKGPWRCAIWVGNDNSDGLYSEAKTAPLAILLALLSALSGDKQ